MNFTDREFLPFLAVVLLGWVVLRRRYWPCVCFLVASSLVFYAFRAWWLVGLIGSYCVVDWLAGLWIARSSRPRLPLVLGIAFNLGVLAFWKYTPLLLRTAAQVCGLIDLPFPLSVPAGWLLPWGISFYTFTGIAYLVDVYRGDIPAETSFVRFCLYKTFFPQLVAGPILRPTDFLVHLRPETMPTAPLAPLEAFVLLARGCFEKLVLADRIALAIDPYFAHVADASTAGVWALPYVYLYALQILFDFCGYTHVARGLGLLFGYRWPENFARPYLAGSVTEFWKRWHITLSGFLRDYLYVPLGGNRGGPWRTSFNLMLTMLLGGLWHGATWSFLLWGALHGAFLIAHKLWAGTALRARLVALDGVFALAYRAVAVVVTFHLVCLAWCFFRLTVLSESLACVTKWVVFDADKALVGGAVDPSLWTLIVAYGVGASAVAALNRPAVRPALRDAQLGLTCGFYLGVAVLAVLLAPAEGAPPFIYFQF